MRMDEAPATTMSASPATSAAVFSEPSDDVPAVPELMALSATYTAGCARRFRREEDERQFCECREAEEEERQAR
jgi:hypothetical protein